MGRRLQIDRSEPFFTVFLSHSRAMGLRIRQKLSSPGPIFAIDAPSPTGSQHLALRRERLFLEKNADAIGRVLEVAITGMALIAGREHRARGLRSMLGQQFQRALAQRGAGRSLDEVLDNQHAVTGVGGPCRRR